ncbi:hypothetical protein KXX64_008679, partial [Aspergillus fumigatus]
HFGCEIGSPTPRGQTKVVQQLQEILTPNIQKAIGAGKNPNWEHHRWTKYISVPSSNHCCTDKEA